MNIEIKTIHEKVLFSHHQENNSLKITLEKAIIEGADLRNANLQCADLRWANLRDANLRDADLRSANLRGANLRYADLRGANLRCANLQCAGLRDANLRCAYLQDASLEGADLEGAKLPHFQIIPQTGSFIGWKKLQDGVIAKLEIPAEAKRTSSLIGRKNRAEFVKVLELSEGTVGRSKYDDTEYAVGEIVHPDSYDDDIRIECTHGIHFFITREEAEEY